MAFLLLLTYFSPATLENIFGVFGSWNYNKQMFSNSTYYTTIIFLQITHTRVNVYKPKCQKQMFILSYTSYNKSYTSPNIVRVIKPRRMRWVGHVARVGEERRVYGFLVGKPKGKRPLGRPRHRLVDNFRMDLQEVGCGYMDWIGLVKDRDRWRTLVSAVMNLRVPWNAGNFLTSCKPVSFSRRTLHRGVSK